jgi:pyruvate-formate lyase
LELLACLWIKLNELTVVKEGGTAKASNTYNDFQNLNLAGQTADGRCYHDWSFLCLEVTGSSATPAAEPGLSPKDAGSFSRQGV